jgi:hypothetical protein
VWRSLLQLTLGTYMVWDARRLRLCSRHFEAAGSASPASAPRAAFAAEQELGSRSASGV